MALNYSDIENILKKDLFKDLKGQLENSVFDVKESPYDFNKEENKQELCKDVAGLANNSGGFIILGISEIIEQNLPHRRVSEVKGLKHTSINKQTYIEHITRLIYPKLEVEFEYAMLDGKEIFYIKVPENLRDKPYLVKGKGDFFGYYVRTDEHGLTTKIEQIHEVLVKGLQFENHLVAMNGKLDLLVEKIMASTEEIAKDGDWVQNFKKLL